MLTWTSEPPTKEGWYFYQAINGNHPIRMGYVGIRIYPQINAPVLTLYGCHNIYGQAIRDDWSVPLQDVRAEHRWAGPIPEPEEAYGRFH